MTQTSLSAARSTRRGEKLPAPAHRCAAARHAVSGGIQFLIANLELEFHSTHRKISPLKISNRKFSRFFRRSDQDRRPERTERVEGRSFLIHGSAIKTCPNLHCFNHMQISNRRQTGGKRRSDEDRRPERTERVEGRSFLIHGSAIKTCPNLHCFNHMQISNRRQTGGQPTTLFALELSKLLVECAPVRTLLLTILFVSPAAAQSWTVETTGWDSNLRAVVAIHSSNPAAPFCTGDLGLGLEWPHASIH